MPRTYLVDQGVLARLRAFAFIDAALAVQR
jgi:hypothetical protein